jgi:hypothetical protein
MARQIFADDGLTVMTPEPRQPAGQETARIRAGTATKLNLFERNY